MDVKKGNEFPAGSVVYHEFLFWPYVYVCRTEEPFNTDYFFSQEDGLWATEYSRYSWKQNPETHPNVTLFELLYKKLEI